MTADKEEKKTSKSKNYVPKNDKKKKKKSFVTFKKETWIAFNSY